MVAGVGKRPRLLLLSVVKRCPGASDGAPNIRLVAMPGSITCAGILGIAVSFT